MSSNLKPITIGLAGNPNCGKTTLFNALTGMNQHVGNYSGVTVEKKDGQFTHEGRQINVIDLPGTYSLNYHSPEERIAQEEILSGNIDILVAVVDSGTLARGLVFVTQLMQLGMPIILCLNMFDEIEKAGIKIDVSQMQSLLGFPIIPTVASKGRGVPELKNAICNSKLERSTGARLRLGDVANDFIQQIINALPQNEQKHAAWTATKLLCNDPKYTEDISASDEGKKAVETAKQAREHIEADSKLDIQLYMTEQYYGFIDGMLKEVMTKAEARKDAREQSDKIDKVLVHPIFGSFFFLLIVYLLFQITFTVGAYPMEWIEALFGWLGGLCEHMSDGWLKSLLIDGVIGGVGGVVVFLPNILILFLGLSFLEDSGYMARCAFLMDKIMHKFGLHGRSFIPLITGFGCSVPGLMATRTIAGEKERLTTMMILPLMSCGARLPIWLLLVPVFFPQAWNAPAMMGIYLLGIIVAFIAAVCLRKTIFKGEEEPFVMELPPYRLPTLRATITHMFERAWLYLKKAGTIILPVSIILWALGYWHPGNGFDADKAGEAAIVSMKSNQELVAHVHEVAPNTSFEDFVASAEKTLEQKEQADDASQEEEIEKAWEELSNDEKLEKIQQDVVLTKSALVAEADLESSAIGMVGHAIEPVFKPIGFDWKIATAVIGAFAAKEVFVAQMGIVYSLGEGSEDSQDLKNTLQNQYSLSQGIALIIWLLISAPCMATVAVMKRESGSWKYALAQFGGLTLLAYILAMIAYQVLRLILGA